MRGRRVYLDHNATTPLAPGVLEQMTPYLGECFGNPSSKRHMAGREAFIAIERAREQVAEFLNCFPEELVFTSGGSEGNSQAILDSTSSTVGHSRIATSTIEHPSILEACRFAGRCGATVTYVGVDSAGLVNPGDFEQALAGRPTLVSVMSANNETGVIQPIEHLCKRSHQVGALFHTDAVQSLGKMPISLATLPVDLLTLAGHKLGGPKGTGVLFVRRGIPVRARIFGGGQERGVRGGTENVAGIIGLGAACEIASRRSLAEHFAVQANLDFFEASLLRACPGGIVFGQTAPRLPNTLLIAWPGCPSDLLLQAIDRRGTMASAGSACSSEHSESSHVLRAMGVHEDLARCAVRFSIGFETTREELEASVEVVSGVVLSLQNRAWADSE